MFVKRTAARAAVAIGLFALLSSATSAQIARPQKAKLALEPQALVIAAGAELRIDALATVDPGWHVQAHVPTYDYLIPTTLTLELPAGFPPPGITFPRPSRYKFAFAGEELDVYEGLLRIPVSVRVPENAAPGTLTIAGSLRYQACDDKSCLPPVETRASVELTVVNTVSGQAQNRDEKLSVKGKTEEAKLGTTEAPAPFVETPVAAAEPSAPARSLAGILLLALVGGLILNGMPCVLPILSLKLFGLVKAAGESRGSVRSGAFATAAGIVLSFWGLALAAIGARGAGAAIGWGIQFQQPGFVAFLAVVILLFSLNLWGLFEIPLPAGMARLADSTGGEGLGGHFASGLFATLMATPCSAPFLGTALSFALGQSALVIFATLSAVGVGLALPYLALALWPGFVRYLPKPGAWMDTLRGAMGFLLAGALVWLLYVLGSQIAAEFVAFFQLALLLLCLAVWLANRVPLGSRRRALGWAAALALGVAAVVLATDAPAAAKNGPSGAAAGRNAIAWQPYDRAEAERLAASGRLVFLDVTADWCVTCKVNERLILNTPEVSGLFRQLDVVAMKADWTNRDDGIARFLADHGRYGIPFYMLYRPGRAPHLFGELITKQEVIDVLSAARSTALPPS